MLPARAPAVWQGFQPDPSASIMVFVVFVGSAMSYSPSFSYGHIPVTLTPGCSPQT